MRETRWGGNKGLAPHLQEISPKMDGGDINRWKKREIEEGRWVYRVGTGGDTGGAAGADGQGHRNGDPRKS